MSNYLRQKIKINLEYQGRKISTDVPPYKTIKYIKDLAKNLFYPINFEIRLIYQHKDITPYEQSIIGDFFKRKNQVYIKIITYSQKDKEHIDIHEEEKKNPINKLTASKKGIFICSCKNDLVGNYCRNCKDFICNSCRINKEHESHRVTQVDIDNLVESVKLYAITLQSEVLSNIKSTKDFCKKNEKRNNNTKRNIHSRYHILKDKYDKIYEIYNKFMNDINPNNNETLDADLLLADYIQKTNITNDDIEKILTDIYVKYTKQRKGMSADDFNNYFKILSQKEDELEIQSTDILAFRVNYEIDEKMNQIYDKIEQILDITLNAKIPLGLDSNSFYLYKIVKEKKEKSQLIYNDDEDKNKEEENNEYSNKLFPNGEMNFKEKEMITSIDKKPEDKDNDNDNDNDNENEVENNNDSNHEKEEEDENSITEQKKLREIRDKNLMQNIEKNDLINRGVLQDNNQNENEDNYNIDNENQENINIENNEDLFDNNNNYENENEEIGYQENEEDDPEKYALLKENAGNYIQNENNDDD